MAGFVTNALSGLLAAQRALQTTSSNIANATTEGYTRQRVVQVQGPVIGSGNIQFGYGTQVTGVERIYDQLLANQLTGAKTAQHKSQILNQYALRLEGYLGDTETGISSGLQSFYQQLNTISNDPTSSVNRQQLLAEAEALAQRFRQMGKQLDSLDNEINQRLRSAVQVVNDDLTAIARLNGEIVADGSRVASALLDERQMLIDRVASQIDIQTVAQPGGSVNLMMTNGQPLVLSVNTFRIAVTPDEFDPTRLQLAHTDGTTTTVVSRKVSGGEIGGMLSFREEMLDPTRRELGQIALGITETFNRQNRLGLDQNGNLGGDMFDTIAPTVLSSSENAGTATATAVFADASSAEPRDYKLRYDGVAWNFSDANSGALLAATGAGTVGNPFVIDGMEIVIGGGAAVSGDEFRVRPMARAASDVSVVMLDAREIAAAGLLETSDLLANIGSATVGGAVVDDVNNPSLLDPITVVFDDPPSTYVLVDSFGPVSGSLPYTSGGNISANGWTVQINGQPAAGDAFAIRKGIAGSGNNSNAIALAAQFSAGFFNAGRDSVQELSAQLTTSVGSYAARSSSELDVQSAIRQQMELDVEAVAGVNLEEEAVNMLRYQEAYLAASKMISVSNDLFQSIINAIR